MNWRPDEVEILQKLWPFKSAGYISNVLGRSRTAVVIKARKMGLMRKRDPIARPGLPLQEIVKLYQDEWSLQALAKHYNTSVATIRKRLVAAGIAIRPLSEQRKSEFSHRKMSKAASLRLHKNNPMKNPEIAKKSADSQRGSKNHNWKGGISNSYKYGLESGEYESLSRATRERFNNTCQRCFITADEGAHLHMHHRDGDKKNNDPSNLTCLCQPCHIITHWEMERGEKACV